MGLTQQMPLAFLAQLSWFQTYLFDRTQVVSVNGNSSPPSVMKFGVPQGSVLGPILFVLYTQPLLDIVHHHSMSHHSFSDDNQLYKSGHISQLLNIIQSTQRCISDLRDWMTNSKLQLNEDKTDMILISPRNVLNNIPFPSEICTNGTNIQLSQTVHNLGVTLEQTLSFQQHISNVCRTCYLELRRIRTIHHYLSEDSRKTLICVLVLSRLDYCNALLSGSQKHLFDRLQKAQNNAAQLIYLPVFQIQSCHLSSPYPTLAPIWKQDWLQTRLTLL